MMQATEHFSIVTDDQIVHGELLISAGVCRCTPSSNSSEYGTSTARRRRVAIPNLIGRRFSQKRGSGSLRPPFLSPPPR